MDPYVKLADRMLRQLCVIPAPSKNEMRRAQYCLNRLKDFGVEAYMDAALNVICEFPCPDTEDTVIFQAHTDVVFPDTTPLPFSEDTENIYNPGCGDDIIQHQSKILTRI